MQVVHIIFTCLVIKLADAIDSTVGSYFRKEKILFRVTTMESDWVLEYVINLINSPAWEVPVMAFIEENCIVFDSDDENKFAVSYTVCSH